MHQLVVPGGVGNEAASANANAVLGVFQVFISLF
jgi:hypothetical protein